MKNNISFSLDHINEVARDFLEQTDGNNLIAFYAPMGAGKTTFITAVCKAFGVSEDAVSSPTIFHFDFYRITKAAEALDIGLYDYLDSGCLCLMEWPENVEDLLPEETLKVYIGVNPDGSRTVSWED